MTDEALTGRMLWSAMAIAGVLVTRRFRGCRGSGGDELRSGGHQGTLRLDPGPHAPGQARDRTTTGRAPERALRSEQPTRPGRDDVRREAVQQGVRVRPLGDTEPWRGLPGLSREWTHERRHASGGAMSARRSFATASRAPCRESDGAQTIAST
jgi:hypothetical protein